jgi:hypothetical protein
MMETVTCTCCDTTVPANDPGVMADHSMSRKVDGDTNYSGLCPKCFANPAWKLRLGPIGCEHPAPIGPCHCPEPPA